MDTDTKPDPRLPSDAKLRVRKGNDGTEHIPDMTDWDRGWSKTLCGTMGGHVDCYRLAGLETPGDRPQCAECARIAEAARA